MQIQNITVLVITALIVLPPSIADDPPRDSAWARLEPFFRLPPEFQGDDGRYRSPLRFADSSSVLRAEDWPRRRREILESWHGLLGAWPPVIEKPVVETLSSERRDGFVEHRVRFQLTLLESTDAYLLVPVEPGSETGARKPAVLVVYYEPETAVGRGKEHRDFALQLARRGFVALSVGHDASIYYPSREHATLQPLSALAYAAANAYHVLATRPEVDRARIGVTGHSYGGKWALFAAAFYEPFACAAVSDPGVAFDETRPNVNYWEPWYLGWEAGRECRPGVPGPENPRTGAYRELVARGMDLHELHALIAPRPLFVSGGSEDPPERWRALRHAVEVNRLLGHEGRVGMTNRPEHTPDAKAVEDLCLFFEHFLSRERAEERAGKREVELVYDLDLRRAPDLDGAAVEKTRLLLQKRIEASGLKSCEVSSLGGSRVAVRVRSADGETLDTVRRLIETPARLSFQLVAEGSFEAAAMERLASDEERSPQPPALVVRRQRLRSDPSAAESIVLRNDPAGALLGIEVEDALAAADPKTAAFAVDFTLQAASAQALEKLTAANLGRRFAIVVDGEVVSVSTITSPITTPARFQGTFTRRDVEVLASVLRGGALPGRLVLLSLVEQRWY
jgi:hypothetical protein